MNASPILPKTPVRTPQSGAGTKSLQLTPIWESVVRSRRIPTDVSESSVFQEISSRLGDLEWPVRQHAFRVLYDLIPIVSRDRLDESFHRNDILAKLIANLGHPAPGVRKVATETIREYAKQTRYSEEMLESIVSRGVRCGGGDEGQDHAVGIVRENVVLGTIVSLVDILRPFMTPESGGYVVSQEFLNKVVVALAERMTSPLYQEKSAETLWKIREMVGDVRFRRSVERIPDKSLAELVRLRDVHDNPVEPMRSVGGDVETSVTTYHNLKMMKDGNGNVADWSDTDTYTKEDDDEEEEDASRTSPRVVLETEIQFSEDKAIKMTIVEDEAGAAAKSNEIDLFPVGGEDGPTGREESTGERRFVTEDGDLIMKILHDTGEEPVAADGDGERRRTPRRVRFGGEVIKLRTPDSDETDVGGGDGTGESGRSQIPVPVNPATKSPSPGRLRRVVAPEEENKPVQDINGGMSSDSANDSEEDSNGDDWKWTELNIVSEEVVADLKNQAADWKLRYQALDDLKLALATPKLAERLWKAGDNATGLQHLSSLLRCLLHVFPRDATSSHVTSLSVSIVFQLIRTLPRDILRRCLRDIVRGLCRHVGGTRDVDPKIEAVQSLKMLFVHIEPSAVIDVLLGDCLASPNSKIRENALLAVMYAMMTFPSDLFDPHRILESVARAASDARRRVRHAALEAMSVVSQYCSPEAVSGAVSRSAETLPPSGRSGLVSAVQARLSRRVLPTVSSEGLVLYSLQIPASRRFGSVGNPSGADVDWILSGTGSISTGSARSRGQLMNAAQRLDMSPAKWRRERERPDNPWTKRTEKQTTTSSSGNWSQLTRAPSTGSLADSRTRDEQQFQRIRTSQSQQLWSDIDQPTLAPLRPVYLRFQTTGDRHAMTRSTDDLRRISVPYAQHRGRDEEELSRARVLTPSALREKYRNEDAAPDGTIPSSRCQRSTDGQQPQQQQESRIPVLQSGTTLRAKATRTAESDRKLLDSDGHAVKSNGVHHSHQNGQSSVTPSSPSSSLFPRIHNHSNGVVGSNHHDYGYVAPQRPQYVDLENGNVVNDALTHLDGLLSTTGKSGKSTLTSRTPEAQSYRNNLVENETILPIRTSGKTATTTNGELPLANGQYYELKGNQSMPNGVTSRSSLANNGDQTPSTSSSNSTEFGSINGNGIRLQRLKNGSGALDSRKLKSSRAPISKNNKVTHTGSPFPDNLKPFDRPKDGLETCFSQLESQQWEVVMLGLTSLVRLLRHHPAVVLSQIHPIIIALGRQIRNLRSQVSRAACQAAAEMFVALKRNIEVDLEELAGPLFHRSADTNRFIRLDCAQALDNMTDNVSPAKAINVIITKGSMHQNAVVRTVAARLLLRLSEKVGPEKILSLPREARDKVVQTGANLLMEGKLETRAYAKELFRVWSTHPSFSSLMLEAIPPNVMRHISKTLISLKT